MNTPEVKKTRRRSAPKVGSKTLDQILARQESLLKELGEIGVELERAVEAYQRGRKFLQQGMSLSQPQAMVQPMRPSVVNVPEEFTKDNGSTAVGLMTPEQQIDELHNNLANQLQQITGEEILSPEHLPF